MKNLIASLIIGFVACLTLVLPNLYADVYTWTDEKGVKHYSNVAPSEAAGEQVQKEEELPGDLEEGEERPVNAAEQPVSEKSEGEAAETRAEPAEPNEESSGPQKAAEPEAAADASPSTEQESAQFEQGDAIDTEKSRARDLAEAITEGSLSRDELLENEKTRLEQIIQDLEKAPLDQFGSQKNKRRQIGYYQYRLQELINSPDTYLQYGQSEESAATAESAQQ